MVFDVLPTKRTCHQRHQGEDDETGEQDLRDASGTGSKPTETEKGGDKSDDEKRECCTKHGWVSFRRRC